jgi:hypothetical protein
MDLICLFLLICLFREKERQTERERERERDRGVPCYTNAVCTVSHHLVATWHSTDVFLGCLQNFIIVMMNLYEKCGENDMETTNLVPNPKAETLTLNV